MRNETRVAVSVRAFPLKGHLSQGGEVSLVVAESFKQRSLRHGHIDRRS